MKSSFDALMVRPLVLDSLVAVADAEEQSSADGEVRESLEEQLAAARNEGIEIGRLEERSRCDEKVSQISQQAAADLQAAIAKERAQVEQACGALGEAAKIIRTSAAHWLDALEANVCALAVAVARQLVGDLAQRDPTLVQGLVRDALSRLGPVSGPVRVRLNPADLDVVRASLPSFDGPDFELHADPSIQRGGCVVEGPDRLVNADIESGLAAIYRRLVHG